MKLTDHPFNISILKITPERLKGLKPVTTSDIMGSSGERLGSIQSLQDRDLSWSGASKLSSDLNENGLFSISIFGRVGSEERDSRFSYIDIRTQIYHPIFFKNLKKLKGLYTDILAAKAYARWDPVEKDFVLANEIEGNTGFSFFMKHWSEIAFKKTASSRRDDRIKLLEKFRDSATVSKILVMPAGLRDVRMGSNNRLEYDEINDLYKRIVSISKVTTSGGEAINSMALDYSRYQLQLAFNAIYDHITKMLRDKRGFVQNKWAKRRVFNGTRNVITSMATAKSVLGESSSFRSTDTVTGLYQTLKGALPFTINKLRSGYLSEIFSMGDHDSNAVLVDPKTLKRVTVKVSPNTKDRWTTTDGLEKVLNTFKDESVRHQAIVVEDYYLALIYKGPDLTFRIFGDIDELPLELDRSLVEPISLAELLYLSGYREWNNLKVIITRYPVTGLGSSYPSNVFIKTTNVPETRMELGPDWQRLGDDYLATAFPVKTDHNFLGSTIVSIVRMGGLGAD